MFTCFSLLVVLLSLLPTPLVSMIDSLFPSRTPTTFYYPIILSFCILPLAKRTAPPPFSRCVLYPVDLWFPARVSFWPIPAVPRRFLQSFASHPRLMLAVGVRKSHPTDPPGGHDLQGRERKRPRAADREKGWKFGPNEREITMSRHWLGSGPGAEEGLGHN